MKVLTHIPALSVKQLHRAISLNGRKRLVCKGALNSRGGVRTFQDQAVEDQKGVKEGKIIIRDSCPVPVFLGNNGVANIPVYHGKGFVDSVEYRLRLYV